MTKLDQLQRRQGRLLVLFALSFAVWQIATLMVEYSAVSGSLQHVFIAMMIASGLFWFVIMVLLFGSVWSGKNKTTQALAQDEWQRYISGNTASASYLCLLSIIGLGVLWTTMVGPIDGAIVVRVLLIVGVVVPMLLAVVLDRFMGGSEDE